jgi:hypothetical protein
MPLNLTCLVASALFLFTNITCNESINGKKVYRYKPEVALGVPGG